MVDIHYYSIYILQTISEVMQLITEVKNECWVVIES